jgi:hypothetical protein
MCVLVVSILVWLMLALIICALNREPPKRTTTTVRDALWNRYRPDMMIGVEQREALARAREGDTTEQARAAFDYAVSTVDSGDRVAAYGERVIDRQINKLIGVLSFDALILAFLSLERGRIAPVQRNWDLPSFEMLLLTVAILLLALSSCL